MNCVGFRHILKGYKKVLVFDDLYDLMDRDKCQPIVKMAEAEWTKQTKGLNYKRYTTCKYMI